MKISWGTGIVISFVLFMTAVAAIVIFAMNKDVDLVEENYYDKEINYQHQIDMVNRTNTLDKSIKVTSQKGYIRINCPSEFCKEDLTGEIYFYRPSNRHKDFKLAINLNEQGEQYISTEKVSPGMWKLKLSWKMQGEEYYKEETILIN